MIVRSTTAAASSALAHASAARRRVHRLVYLDYRVRLFTTPLGCFAMGAAFSERGLPCGWLALVLAYGSAGVQVRATR